MTASSGLLLPSLRLDYVRGRKHVEFESGAELGRRDAARTLRTAAPATSSAWATGCRWIRGPDEPARRAAAGVAVPGCRRAAGRTAQRAGSLHRRHDCGVRGSPGCWRWSNRTWRPTARDYIALYAVEINIAGKRATTWRPSSGRQFPAGGSSQGDARRSPLRVEDRQLQLKPLGQDAARRGHQQVAAGPAGSRRPACHL